MTTIESIYREHSDIIWEQISAGTRRGYQSAWNQRVRASFGSLDIEGLSVLTVRSAVAKWKISESSKTDAITLLSHLCEIAIEGKLIGSNPARFKRKKVQISDPTSRALTHSELRKLFELVPASGPYLRFISGLLFTGCRFSELSGIRVSDLDLDASVISVRRSFGVDETGAKRVGDTKGHRARSVPIVAPLLPLIFEAIEGRELTDYVFPGPRGGRLDSKNMTRALRWFEVREQIKKFAPEEEKLHWHDLRHTACVLFFEAGMTAPDVQHVMGHSSLAVTNLYSKSSSAAAVRGAQAMNALFERVNLGADLAA